MFDPVDPKVNFAKLEEEILALWQKEKTFAKVQANRASGRPFVFFEGPPTANAKPGIHHVEARAFKDLIPRFQTMRGRRVDRKAGWDTHGLPVELQVEKKLGLKNKKDIEKYGVAKFNAECQKDVWQNVSDWQKMTERIGFWLDFDDAYITYKNEYIESVWAIIKHISSQKDTLGRPLLYQGHKVVPLCPRCGTALSSHEVAQGYRFVDEEALYVKFKLTNQALQEFGGKYQISKIKNQKLFVLAWTTTPWTLPGNVALAVKPEVEYVIVRDHEDYIVAKDLVQTLTAHGVISGQTVGRPFKGSELVGLSYEPLFPGAVTPNKQAFKIYSADFVTTTDGTGIVHTAVMYGEDDYQLGVEVGLPQQHTVSEDGRFLAAVGESLQDRPVKDPETEKIIKKQLADQDLLLTTRLHGHDYPFCWRCETPLLYYARDSWFIRMSSLRENLLEQADKIHWEPASIKSGRMGEWLANVKDWAISRERYWGTPLPIWTCKNDHITIVGSAKELKDLVSTANFKFLQDLHRPFIDDVHFACPDCGKEASRVPEVMDVWFDSGSMPFAQWHWPHQPGSEEQLNLHYPADFISEAIDQTRGWFYTLLAIATLMGKEAPYRNVICLGHVLDEQGKKMSKSKGNVVDPMMMIERYGADALRFYFYVINPPGEPKLFAEKDLQTISRRVVMLLWNVYSFFVTFANESAEKFEIRNLPRRVKAGSKFEKSSNVLDQWVESRLNQLIEVTTKSLEEYDVLTAARAVAEFIDDLSTWYVRRSRHRFSDAADPQDRSQALATLYHVLVTLTQVMAPFMPFVTDYIHRRLAKESVHVQDWPDKEKVNDDVIKQMQLTRQIVSSGLEARMAAKVKIRQVLSSATVFLDQDKLDQAYLDLIRDELNVETVTVQTPTQATQSLVVLDTILTPELIQKGLQRELVRAIQEWRKTSGLLVSDQVKIQWRSDDPELLALFKTKDQVAAMQQKTKAQFSGPIASLPTSDLFDLNNHQIHLDIKKI